MKKNKTTQIQKFSALHENRNFIFSQNLHWQLSISEAVFGTNSRNIKYNIYIRESKHT